MNKAFALLVAQAVLFAGGNLCAAVPEDLPIVRDGRVNCVLIVSASSYDHLSGSVPRDRGYGNIDSLRIAGKPVRFEEFAAGEIKRWLGKAAAGEIEVISAGSADAAAVQVARARTEGKVPIVLGHVLSGPEGSRAILEKGDDFSSFLLKADNGVVEIIGLSPLGVMHGAYELLEQLGFRWFIAGELGEVIPEEKQLRLKPQATVQVPSFKGRLLGGGWLVMNHMDWSRRMRCDRNLLPSQHICHSLIGNNAIAKEVFARHPEYFALYKGKRSTRQLCVTNPDVLKEAVNFSRKYFQENPGVIMSLDPSDGGGFCECDKCRALDPDIQTPFRTPGPSMTDRYIWFGNRLLEELGPDFPARIEFMAYNATMMPPVRVKPDRRFIFSIATIHICRLHAPGNPVCPEKNFYSWIAGEWQKQGRVTYDFAYWYNLADPGLPFQFISRFRQEIPHAYELGLREWKGQLAGGWQAMTPSQYIAGRLMWDHKADVDAILKDFCQKFYGPGADAMESYIRLMDVTLRDADYHTGSSWDVPRIYPAAMRRQCSRFLDEAKKRAAASRNPRYAQRVELARQGFDYLEAFVAMMEERNRHDFVPAKASLDRMRSIFKSLMEDYDIPMTLRSYKDLLEGMYGSAVEQGYQRVTGGNRLAAPLKSRWQFMIDPQMSGDKTALYREEISGGGWQTIDTGDTWGNQGLRYYYGQAWYRQSITIPASFKGSRIKLWFAGVDRTADVWVNGKPAGSNHNGAIFDLNAFGAAFVPFEFDVTDLVRFGQSNTVAVRTVRDISNEIGTGGIMGPAMFYAAKP